MSVWFAIPSACYSQAKINLPKWKAKGYKVAVYLTTGKPYGKINADLIQTGAYFGWPKTSNLIAKFVIKTIPDCTIVIAGGDDMFPLPTDPDAGIIEKQFIQHFKGTMGVMQPTGDLWMNRVAERICGSPWLGKQFIRVAYKGMGPFWPEYNHFYADEELKVVTAKSKLLWQREDLTHYHNHWTRNHQQSPIHMEQAQQSWETDGQLFVARRKLHWPGW